MIMTNCCIWFCKSGSGKPYSKLHRLPFAKSLWKEWLKRCPYLGRYTLRQLESKKICSKHFLPEHLYELRGSSRLTDDAIPLLKLDREEPQEIANCTGKVLEISPVLPNKPVNVKIIDNVSCKPVQIDSISTCVSPENRTLEDGVFSFSESLVYIKPGQKSNVPVDHSMYCLPLQTEDISESLFTERNDDGDICALSLPDVRSSLKCEQSSDDEELPDITSLICINHEENSQVPDDHNSYCLPSRLEDSLESEQNNLNSLSTIIEYISEGNSIKEEIFGTVDSEFTTNINEEELNNLLFVCVPTRLSDTDTDLSQHFSSEYEVQLPDALPTNAVDSLKSEPVELERNQSTLSAQLATHDNLEELSNLSSLTNSIPNITLETDSVDQFSIFLTPNIFNLLRSKSPLDRTVELLRTLFSTIKEKHNLPVDCVSNASSQIANSNFDNISSKSKKCVLVANTIANVEQPLQDTLFTKTQTLESLVAELIASDDMVEIHVQSDIEPSLDSTQLQPVGNPLLSNDLTCSVQHAPKWKRFCSNSCNQTVNKNPDLFEIISVDKNYSTQNERLLKLQNRKLKAKLRVVMKKRDQLKLKLKKFIAETKHIIDKYKLLNNNEKFLIDTQLRLAGLRTCKFNKEEKIFALKLYKFSPQCYKLLQQYIKLPKRATIQQLAKNDSDLLVPEP